MAWPNDILGEPLRRPIIEPVRLVVPEPPRIITPRPVQLDWDWRREQRRFDDMAYGVIAPPPGGFAAPF
jgi:hypothetical protein